MLKASAQKMLPIPMPALAALLRDVEGGGEDVEGAAGLIIVEGRAVMYEFVAEDAVEGANNDEAGVVSTAFEEVVV